MRIFTKHIFCFPIVFLSSMNIFSIYFLFYKISFIFLNLFYTVKYFLIRKIVLAFFFSLKLNGFFFRLVFFQIQKLNNFLYSKDFLVCIFSLFQIESFFNSQNFMPFWNFFYLKLDFFFDEFFKLQIFCFAKKKNCFVFFKFEVE